MDLLEVAFDKDVWTSVLDKGVDKTLPRSLLKAYSSAEARVDLLDSILAGDYHVAPPKVCQIPKDNGKVREIYVNKPRDRILLAVANQAYLRLYKQLLSPACKAYLDGSSCSKTVREVASQQICGYKLDLSKYFDSVSKDVLTQVFDEIDTGSPLDDIVREYYMDDRVRVDSKLVTRYKSLAQGCAVSAFLSNYVLRDVDARMLEMCDYYCRYSDDMLLLGRDTDAALAELQQMLAKLGLGLNPDKVEKVDASKEFKFLGFGVRGSAVDISLKDFELKKREVKHACRVVQTNRSLTSEQKLTKAVREVKRFFFDFSDPFHGWLYSKATAVNSYDRLADLDKFCKEHIRAAYTGKWNYTSNVHKVSEDDLRAAGYVSLVQMAKLARISRDAYQQEHLLSVEQVRKKGSKSDDSV